MWRVVRGLSVMLLVLVSAATPHAYAQGTGESPEVPFDCSAEPASILSVLDAVNRAEEYWDFRYGFYFQTVSQTELQRGDPLTAEDLRGVEWTLYQLVACANDVSPLQVLGLLSTEYQAILALQAIDERNFDDVAGYVPVLATQTADMKGVPELTIIHAWYDPETNKRVHAVVEPYLAESEQAVQFLVTFLWDKDRWIVDWVSLLE